MGSIETKKKNKFFFNMADVDKPSATFMNKRPVWIPDEQALQCKKCNSTFNLIRRKHHCRNCGDVFCGSCSTKSVTIPKLNYRYEVRVCDDCHGLLSRPM